MTATITWWIVERVADENQKKATVAEDQVGSLRGEIDERKGMVRELRPAA